jgi:hypothetical protein
MMNMSEDHLDELVNDPVRTVQRWTERVVSGRVGDLERQVHENSTENARLRVQIAMDRDPELGSTWRAINNDTAFLAWLDGVDPLAGVPRMQLLQRAYNVGNPGPVSAIFKAFIASQIPSRERTATRLPHEGTGPKPAVRASAGVNEARRRVWTAKEIHNFYDDCRRGRYDKREAERLQIENEIFAAAKVGRMAADAIQPRDSKGPLF